MTKKTYKPNETIFQEGDSSEFAYLIKSGKVEILRGYPENPVRLAILGKNEIFGEMSLIEERPHSLTARAISKTSLSPLTSAEFEYLIQHKPGEALKYLRMFFERLRTMNSQLPTEESAQTELPQTEEAEKKSAPSRLDFEVAIFPLTPMMQSYIPEQGFLIKSHIFRVGRNSGRRNDPFEVNDLILKDNLPYHVSRNHFAIEKKSDRVIVHDRGSSLGTIVNGQIIGGFNHGAIHSLNEGDNEVIAGTQISPYKFRVVVRSVLV